MPIYEYECGACGNRFERIAKATKLSWKIVRKVTIVCPVCGRVKAKKVVSQVRIGTKALETTGRSGYLTDELTLGKIADEGGIPYEYKEGLRKRREMLDRQKEFKEGLKGRAKKYKFDPFSDD